VINKFKYSTIKAVFRYLIVNLILKISGMGTTSLTHFVIAFSSLSKEKIKQFFRDHLKLMAYVQLILKRLSIRMNGTILKV
jgi:hypothetical protein